MDILTRIRDGRASPPWAGRWLPWAVLGLSLALTIVASWLAHDLQASAVRQRFAFQQAELLHALRDRMAAQQQTLQGVAGLLRASDQVTRTEWERYVGALRLDPDQHGIKGIGYAAWLKPQDIPRIEGAMRSMGFPEFQVWPRGGRPGVTSIVYLEPLDDRNRRAIGFDMFSDATRRAAMELARDTGAPTLSGKVRLVQEDGQDVQAGFLMYLPHYGVPDPATLTDRRTSLRGFVYAAFRAGDFMAPIRATALRDMRLRLYSGPGKAEDDLLYDSHPDRPWPEAGHKGLRDAVETELPGRVWTAEFTALPGIVHGTGGWIPPALLAIGAAFSLLGFAAVRSTAGLRFASAQNELLGRIIDDAASEVYVLSPRSFHIIQANRGARERLGLCGGDPAARTLLDVQPEMDRDRLDALTAPLLAGAQTQISYETRQRRRDGSPYPAVVTLQAHGNGKRPLLHALVTDVTDAKRQEQALTDALGEARGLLAEKETLLREVHHRVKNNLQVIWSLIKLEAMDVADSAARDRMETIAQRISVLGQIHQHLYGTDNLARVDIAEHVRALGAGLAELHAHQDVEIKVVAGPVSCDLETAIPIGLIVNELVSNSLEHAFPDGRPGHILVTIGLAEGRITLAVSDDGVGAAKPASGTSLGLHLVEALAGQINADLTVETGQGTRTTLRLPEGLCG